MIESDNNFIDDRINIDNFNDRTEMKKQRYDEQDSGFKAWQSESVLGQNNTNLLRNLKSQLLNYEQRYKKSNVNTLPIKLPLLEYIKNKKYSKKGQTKKNPQHNHGQQDKPLTQRQDQSKNREKQNFFKHKSIQLGRQRSKQKMSNDMKYDKNGKGYSSTKLKCKAATNTNNTIDLMKEQKPILITKVQQMKFAQNQKRVRKRDIYLAIFGQRGKGKVQKITFEDENKPYQIYLQRKNQQARLMTSNLLNRDSKEQQSKRSVSNLYNRYQSRKKNQFYNNHNHQMTKACDYINIANSIPIMRC